MAEDERPGRTAAVIPLAALRSKPAPEPDPAAALARVLATIAAVEHMQGDLAAKLARLYARKAALENQLQAQTGAE